MPQPGQAQGAGFLFENDFVASPYHQGIGTVAGSIGKTKPAPQRVQSQFFDGFLSRPCLVISEDSFGSNTPSKPSDIGSLKLDLDFSFLLSLSVEVFCGWVFPYFAFNFGTL